MNTILLSKTSTKATKPLNLRRAALYCGAAILLVGGALPACSTAAGFGRDVEKLGDNIQDSAR